MRPIPFLIGVLSLAAAIACGEAAPLVCGTTPATRLSGEGVGVLKVGATLEVLQQQCDIARSAIIEDAEGAKGQPGRKITIRVLKDTLTTTVIGDRVQRIEIETATFRTTDSVGVGSTLDELKQYSPEVVEGEGGLFARLPGVCGLSFRLAGATAADTARWAELPGSTPVDMVLVVGCRAQP